VHLDPFCYFKVLLSGRYVKGAERRHGRANAGGGRGALPHEGRRGREPRGGDRSGVDWAGSIPFFLVHVACLYPITARAAFDWWEMDITYCLLVFLSWLGVVENLRPLPDAVRDRRRVRT
jgi:hypothetical protein